MFGGIFDNDGDEEKGPKESIDLSNFGRVVKVKRAHNLLAGWMT